jgi:2,4-dienoyl-CoA reductase-like NADH-dependent reductase (Old Yellow Enzyme family)
MVQSNKADFVAYGPLFLSNPGLPKPFTNESYKYSMLASFN